MNNLSDDTAARMMNLLVLDSRELTADMRLVKTRLGAMEDLLHQLLARLPPSSPSPPPPDTTISEVGASTSARHTIAPPRHDASKPDAIKQLLGTTWVDNPNNDSIKSRYGFLVACARNIAITTNDT
ncbi:hypothetical protein, partial, partial [Absidia glauca]